MNYSNTATVQKDYALKQNYMSHQHQTPLSDLDLRLFKNPKSNHDT